MRKYVLLVLAAAFMLSTAVVAQGQGQPRHNKGDKKEMRQEVKEKITPEKRAEYMAKQLQLSDMEKAKVQALFEKQDAKIKQQMEEVKKLKEEQKAKFEANRKAQEDELIKIIGNDKFRQLQSNRIARLEKENRMHRMKMMQQARPGTEQQRMMMEKMRKMHQERMKKEQQTEN
ncbi:MAG: hypothetical protein VB102_03130 [Paludibacter sp.]|nr:hypothetical protein [Paludibacter sp.]